MRRHAPMKRTGFKTKPQVELKAAPEEIKLIPINIDVEAFDLPPILQRPRPGVRMARDLAAEAPKPVAKDNAFRSEAWLRAVRSIPCVFCGAPVQAAHRNEWKGIGLKTDDCWTAAICPTEHAEIDQGRDMTREERRARMDRAIVLTLRELVRRGLVRVA